MRTCSKCGAENPEDVKFCVSCGAEFPNKWRIPTIVRVASISLAIPIILFVFLFGILPVASWILLPLGWVWAQENGWHSIEPFFWGVTILFGIIPVATVIRAKSKTLTWDSKGAKVLSVASWIILPLLGIPFLLSVGFMALYWYIGTTSGGCC